MGFLTRIRSMTLDHAGGLRRRDGGHHPSMTVVLVVLLGTALWSLLSLPLAVGVGRAFRAGEDEQAFAEIVRGYDASSV